MHASSPSTATLAEIRDSGEQAIAVVRAIFANDHLVIETQSESETVSRPWQDVLDRVRGGAITLLPNGMLRIAFAGQSDTADLGDAIDELSDGQLRLTTDRDGIEHGLTMKQQVW